ncbi:mechanosensitive ion channel family protein [Psychromonas antarctica]|jgi:small-conductance mechanosensitive channel|uniref:mechanosensitive ion channel family protein n=1 Tax=Psychromonas antarctica TaxID=67573 RepID=UPI001EE7CB2D|nr:mechanosensitive ion channel domain-containing protein [Psychromonas antarctica]MCG6202667.1 mechanosensitive ion channel family protein [Psychromonas antarctica]
MDTNEVMNDVADVITSQFSPLLASLLLAISLLLCRYLLLKFWKNKIKHSITEQRKITSISRGIFAAFLVVGMTFIWAPELQAFAISIAAFAVALVVGMKELILAALGGIFRLITGAYKVGDWISVGNIRGEVIDLSLTSTTLERLGPGKSGSNYTGHRIVFPNSKLLAESVLNENEMGPYVLYTISAPIDKSTNIEEAQVVLHKAAMELVDLNSKEAQRFVKKMSQFLDFSTANMKPSFELEYTEVAKGFIKISLFLPNNSITHIEFEILRIYMAWLRSC